jgi:hypothetical protein
MPRSRFLIPAIAIISVGTFDLLAAHNVARAANVNFVCVTPPIFCAGPEEWEEKCEDEFDPGSTPIECPYHDENLCPAHEDVLFCT